MKINQYLLISFGAIMAAAIIVSAIIFYTVTSLRSQNERIRFAQSQLMMLKDISNTLNRMLKEVSDYLLIGEEEEFEEYQAYNNDLKVLLHRYEKITKNEIEFVDDDEKEEESYELETADRFKKDLGLVIATAEQIVGVTKNGDKKAALDLLKNTLESIYDEGFVNVLEDQIEDEENEIQKVNQDLMSLTYRLQYITISTLIMMILFIGLVAILVRRSIYRPIASLVPAIKEIGKGNFNVDINTEANNEIGALAISLQKMVDELRRIQSQLVQSAKLAFIGQLAAGMAHELNQPLMVIRMNAQMVLRLLKESSWDPRNIEESMTLVERNTNRMKHIINHLRTFSRQTNGDRETVDINQVIEDSFTMINEQLKINDIEVKKNLSPDLPQIQGKSNELEQVFVNLISNSKDALPDDGTSRPRQIEISTAFDENRQCIEVIFSDTGIGIAAEQTEKVFDPFYTTKPVGKGTGLGLSIACGIVQDHNGNIELIDTSQQGTTFRIQLPTAEAENAGN